MAARMQRLNFDAINRAGLTSLPALLRRWLPDGRLLGHEYTACNPTRADRRPGSFRINVNSGKWSDFATGDKGGDVVKAQDATEAVAALAILGLPKD